MLLQRFVVCEDVLRFAFCKSELLPGPHTLIPCARSHQNAAFSSSHRSHAFAHALPSACSAIFPPLIYLTNSSFPSKLGHVSSTVTVTLSRLAEFFHCVFFSFLFSLRFHAVVASASIFHPLHNLPYCIAVICLQLLVSTSFPSFFMLGTCVLCLQSYFC